MDKVLQTLALTFLLMKSFTHSNRVKYTGYQAHRFVPETDENLALLKNLEANNPGVIFLRQPGNKGHPVDMVLPPHLQGDFLNVISAEMPNSLLSDDLEKALNHDENVMQLEALDDKEFPFTTYWDFEKVQAFCKNQETLHPDKAKVIEYGKSVEGRPLMGVLIANQQPVSDKTPIMLIDGGMHAREWIGVMVAAFYMQHILMNPEQHKYLENFAVMIVPCANPDGFTYAWTTNRLWRKNRSPNANGNILPHCSGVDPNRNYDFGHGGEGASTDPCSEVYAGPAPFCIPETESFKDFALAHPNIFSYISLHSYSQLVLLSFGCPAVATTYPEMEQDTKMANIAIEELKKKHGTEYKTGNSDEILYPACGVSTDWFLRNVCSFAYTYELRDTGTAGFMLPAKQIAPTCEETTASLISLHNQMASKREQRTRKSASLNGTVNKT